MSTLTGLPLPTHLASLNSKESDRHAWAILHQFFDYFDDDTPREQLWSLLTIALQHDSEDITARHRGEMLLFYECCTALFKAARVLLDRQQRSKKKKKK